MFENKILPFKIITKTILKSRILYQNFCPSAGRFLHKFSSFSPTNPGFMGLLMSFAVNTGIKKLIYNRLGKNLSIMIVF